MGVSLRLASLAAFVVALCLPAATPAGQAIVGGASLDVRDAPWTVMLRVLLTDNSGVFCTGTIIDATHVVTAAHCLDLGPRGRVPTETIVVRAGVSDAAAARPTDTLQERTVTRYRIHPGFHWRTAGSPDDVAVVEVATAFDLGTPVAAAVTLPVPGPTTLGSEVGFAGFGRIGPYAVPTYTLLGMEGMVTACKSAASAVIFCARSPDASMCPGDSGGALVSRVDGTPILIGIGSIASCIRGANGWFTNVRSPEILRFIVGDDHPPVAPRELTPPRLVYSAPPVVAHWLQCAPGTWEGSPSFVYEFRDETGRMLKLSSTPRYRLRRTDVSHRVHCHLRATNVGGTATEDTPAAPRVRSSS